MSDPIGCLYPDLMIGPDDMLIPIAYACTPVSTDPGGGGLGYEPDKDFLRRYDGNYQGRYKPGYKPTLRKG